MPICSSQVLDYLDAHPIHQHEGDFSSLLDMLFFIYTSSNPIENDKIHSVITQLYSTFAPLTSEQENTLFSTLRVLCEENELAAFSHGVLVGMSLMTELNGLP